MTDGPMWWLMALPRETMLRFMDRSGMATGALGIGMLAFFGALPMAAMALVLMRDQVRQGALEAAGFQPAPWVAPQWGPVAVFLVLLVLALLAVGRMVRALVRASRTP